MELLILRRLNVELLNKTSNMKKIFFIFAMLLMSVVSVWAEESIFVLDDIVGSYSDDHFIVDGFCDDEWGFYINNGNKIVIRSKNGEKITNVKYKISYGEEDGYEEKMIVSAGDVSSSNNTINGVNATSLTISSDVWGDDAFFQISKIFIYYEQGNEGNDDEISEEYVLTESFVTTSGNIFLGDNIKVEGNSNGLYIGNGKTVTIGSNNNSVVKILKVDLDFRSNFNGTINSLDNAVVEGSGTNWTIKNIYSSSLKISSPDANWQINNIKVYYVKMSEEKSVTIATTNSGQLNYTQNHIKVSGTKSSNSYGLDIDKGNSVTITSNNGVEISKVELHLKSIYFDYGASIKSSVGVVEGSDKTTWTISDVNSSSLKISHTGDNEGMAVRIDQVTVYYKEPIVLSTMEVAAAFAENAYWTTFYSNACNYQAPEGTQVFKVSLEGSSITMIEIEDRVVNKWEGVVLKSLTDSKITLTKVDSESSDDYSGNSLKGTSSSIFNPGNAYVLNFKTSRGLAFYKLSSTGKIGANKAYLVPGSAAAREFFAFDAAITGIENVNAQDSEDDVKTFDLQGRRVTNPAKGVYIVNGKKVIMK